MSWGIVAGAAIGAVGSYVSQRSANNANAQATKHAGQVDVTTTRQGNPIADPYRQAGMQSAYDALYGTNTGPGPVQGNPASAPAPDTSNIPPGSHVTASGKLVNASGHAWNPARDAPGGAGGKPSGPPAAPAAPAFTGMSPETDQIRQRMMGLPDQNAGMYGASEQFMTDTLGGTERNPYRTQAADAAGAITEDPELAAYQAAIRGQLGIGPDGSTTGKPGGTGNTRISYGYAPGSGGSYGGGGGQASATGTDAALRKLVAGEDPAGWAAMQQNIEDQVAAQRAGNLRELKAQGVGSGFYGGDYYASLAEGASAQGDRQLADSLAAARFGAYQNALGLGTQYDTSMADIAARERAAYASASASGAASAASLAQQRELALYGDWGQSIGIGQQGRTASAGALGDLAHLTSADQQAALQGIDALGASRRGDLGAAGDLSLGSDQARNAYIASQNALKASLASTNAQRGVANAQLAWQQQQFYDPMSRLGQYGNLLNQFYGNLGSETTSGFDARNQSPAQMGSVGGAALSGAALGGQVGSLYNSYSQPAAAQQPGWQGFTAANPYT